MDGPPRRLCKVSPYDGHATVAHTYGGPSPLGVISARPDPNADLPLPSAFFA
jgi:hypothetical protein